MPNGYTYRVEIEGSEGFILDTDLLDNEYLGYVPVDVTEYVRSVRMKSGRSTIQDKFTAGQMSIVFENRDRVFDPNYTSSPIYGAVKPRHRLIFYVTTAYAEFGLLTGWIDAWSFDYDVSTESTATASASDAFTVLSNQIITLTNPPAELTSVRFNRVLDDPSVNWPPEYRDAGGVAFTMGTASYTGDALTYLQQLADSERGYLVVDGYNNLSLYGWNYFADTPTTSYFSDASSSAIPFTSIETSYDTDQFYNYVSVTGYPGTVTLQSTTSQTDYGISFGEFPVLTSGTGQMAYVATHINQKFSQPRFRVSKLTVSADTPALQTIASRYGDALTEVFLLASRLGPLVEVSWTPNNIGTPVTQTGFIIGVDIDAAPDRCDVTFSISADDTRGAY